MVAVVMLLFLILVFLVMGVCVLLSIETQVTRILTEVRAAGKTQFGPNAARWNS